LSRGGRVIVDGLSFRLSGGSALLLTGANGSGKTTLLRALAGFLRPAAGSVRLRNGDEEREPGEQTHFGGHLDGTNSHLTGQENLRVWAAYLDGSGDVAAALDAFARTGLADIPAGYLSAGQKRRLGLARLAAAKRPVWLLDEPTVSLDSASVALLVAAIDAHVAGGGLAVIATHIPMALARAQEIRLGPAEDRA
jgi:heme exporter protein A